MTLEIFYRPEVRTLNRCRSCGTPKPLSGIPFHWVLLVMRCMTVIAYIIFDLNSQWTTA